MPSPPPGVPPPPPPVADRGDTSLSLRRVADAVGVAHRSLYNHFADREALLKLGRPKGLVTELARMVEGI